MRADFAAVEGEVASGRKSHGGRARRRRDLVRLGTKGHRSAVPWPLILDRPPPVSSATSARRLTSRQLQHFDGRRSPPPPPQATPYNRLSASGHEECWPSQRGDVNDDTMVATHGRSCGEPPLRRRRRGGTRAERE